MEVSLARFKREIEFRRDRLNASSDWSAADRSYPRAATRVNTESFPGVTVKGGSDEGLNSSHQLGHSKSMIVGKFAANSSLPGEPGRK
jgi:hypothetical protein